MTPTVDHFLSDFVRRRRKLRATGIFCLICAWILLWMMVVAMIDRWMPLSTGVRLGLLLILMVSIIWGAVRIARLLLVRRYNPILAARQIEAMTPALQERLLTVVTQQSLLPDQRASDELTSVLTGQVTQVLSQRPPDTLINDRQIAPAVFLLLTVAVLMMGLLFVPGLGLPRLAARQITPWMDLPPVSRTQIQLVTGDLDVQQGHPVAIVADITNGPGDAMLFIGPSPDRMTPLNMSRTFADRFAITLSGIEQDMVYQVRSGDAISPLHRLRILTRPMLAKLEVRLDYPDYLDRKPMVMESTTGMIRAPKGTDVTLILHATEPLSDAVVDICGQICLTDPTPDPSIRSARFTLQNTGEWSVTLTSERGVEGKGFDNMQIQAIEDRPPVVQMLYSQLQIHPADSVKLPFIVQDDVSIQDMFLQIELDEIPWYYQPIPVNSVHPVVRDSVTVDLSAMDLSIGQMVIARLVATDRAGQTRTSEPCRILLTPRSVHPDFIRQTQRLQQAVLHAKKIINWPAAASACQRALFQMLEGDHSTKLNDFLAVQIDRAQQILMAIDSGAASLAPSDQLAVHELIEDLETLYQSFAARQIRFTDLNRAELQQVRTSSDLHPSAAEVFFALMRPERESLLAELGLNSSDPDLAGKLQLMIEKEEGVYKKYTPPSVAGMIREWVSRKDPRRQKARIEASARVQALRSDKDQTWLEDLKLLLRTINSAPDNVFPDLVQTTQILEKAHLDPTPDNQGQAIRARETLLTWLDEQSEQDSDMNQLILSEDHEISVESEKDSVWDEWTSETPEATNPSTAFESFKNQFEGYELPLKAYFRVLEKSRSSKK